MLKASVPTISSPFGDVRYDMASPFKPRGTFSFRAINLWLTILWAAMLPLSIVTGWWRIVAFVSVISIYANFASHLAAWRADVPIEPDARTKALLDELEKFLAHREETDITPEDVG